MIINKPLLGKPKNSDNNVWDTNPKELANSFETYIKGNNNSNINLK